MKNFIPSFVFLSLLGCSNPTDSETNLSTEKTKGINDNPQPISYQIEEKDTKGTINQKANPSNQIDAKKMLNVPQINQNPELKYGCEVTSLAMLLQYAGVKVDKMTLAKQIKKDPTPINMTNRRDIIKWGNPDVGFVGDVTGKSAGYAVYEQPMIDLIELYLPERAVDLTKSSFDDLLKQVSNGRPVVVWTTGNYKPPVRWEEWKHSNGTLKTTLDLHVVVLVGYDEKYVYINDPLSGKKQQAVDKNTFIKSWEALNKRAVSYN